MNFPEEMLQTYDIERSIGEGGGGVVYLGYHKRLKKKVVLKRIKGKVSDLVSSRTEVDLLKNLKHSYLPQVIDFIESPEGIYTVMDYIEGESLQQKIDRGYSFGEKEVRKYAEQLCEAVEYLHSQTPPLIHGDIKPDNIMINKDGNVCLIDFNISGFLNGDSFNTVGHTPGFSSPEQKAAFNIALERAKKGRKTYQGDSSLVGSEDRTVALSGDETENCYAQDAETELLNTDRNGGKQSFGSREEDYGRDMPIVDTKSDIYSIGATLYALLGGNVQDIGTRKLVFASGVSDGLRIVISRAVELMPRKRYQSAAEMLRALRQIEKMNGSYRALIRKQRLKTFIYSVILAGSIVLIVLGSRKMSTELENKYEEKVALLRDSVSDNAEKADVDEAYSEALKIHSDRIEPYYYKAYYLYSIGEKYNLISLGITVGDKLPKGDDETYSKLWYLLASTMFDLGDYSEAEEYYYQAIGKDPENASLYRDYAISLIYGGKFEKAEEVLSEAISRGMEKTDIYMVQGELARIKNDYDEAIECFSKVISASDNSQQILRAYVNYSKCCIDDGSEKKLEKCIEILNKGLKQVEMGNRLLIYEQLGTAYIKLGELNDDKSQFINAIEVYEDIVEMSWANSVTYSNLVVLNLRVKNFDEAKAWADKMCDRYPDIYVSYMRRALVEIEIQNGTPDNIRDYSTFVEYYEKADGLYQKVSESGNVDSEMLLLSNTYLQLKNGGWIR